ncbi:hypothetical protein HII36_05165 [Nonomuraea sp. NN258]|uniref:hypothetical protein n=1 Tax=Nonomuraea antri TaxID=2730852 RepID=UPI001569315B|nr:hypothetical protein [Nonomuraea antri]NRQ31226.1 hypothetical protein [Nonomuraea antri]
MTQHAAPVHVEDVVEGRDGSYVVLRVREGGRLIKARHTATGTIWHLEVRDGAWARI